MTLVQHLGILEFAGLLRLAAAQPELEYAFRHALIQDAAYASLVKADRRALHRAVADALRRTDSTSHATLAYQYWLGEDWLQAARCAMRAGADAMQGYALREAIGHYGRTLRAMDRATDAPPELICEATLGWVQAAPRFTPYEMQLARLARAERVARELNDKPRLARILHWIGGVHRASGDNLRATPALVECFALAEELGDDRLAMIPTYYMALVTMDADPRGALTLFDRAIELARKHDDKDVEAYALGTRAMLEARLGEFAQSRRDIQAALDALARARSYSPMTDSDVNLYAAWSYLDMGDLERGLDYGQRGLDTALAADNMDCICYGFACIGFGSLQAGQVSQAIAAFEESIRRAAFSGAAQIENLGRTGLAMAHLSGGRGEAIHDLERALASAVSLNDRLGAALAQQTLGEVFARTGELERASSYLQRAVEYYRGTGARPYLARALQSLAGVREGQGRAAEAEQARAEAAALMVALAGESE